MSTNLAEFQEEKRQARRKSRRPYVIGCLLPIVLFVSCLFAPQLWNRGPFLGEAADRLEIGMTEAEADDILSAFPFIVEKGDYKGNPMWSVWKVPEAQRDFGTPYLLIDFDVKKKISYIKILDI